MRTMLLARFLSFSLLICSSLTFAAEPLLIEEARLVPSDNSPPGFGRSVAIDGDVAVVGATNGGSWPEQGAPGAAYVFERQSNGTWRQVAKLLPLDEDPFNPSNFGSSVAIEGDVIVVGCRFSPQATVFERRDGVWTRAAVLDDTDGAELDIKDGTIISSALLGANLYRRGPTGWIRMQELRNGLPMPDAQYVGPPVALSSLAAFHGSYGNDDGIDPPAPGVLYIYPLGADHLWTGAPPQAIPDPSGLQYPGWPGYIKASGSTALVSGSPENYIFERNAQGVWHITQTVPFGGPIDGNTILTGSRTGEHRVMRRTSSGWTQKASLVTSVNERLWAVALKGNRVVGAGEYAPNGDPADDAYVFTLPDPLATNPPRVEEDFEDGVASGWVAQPNSTFSVASVGGTRVYRQTNITSGATSIYQSADWDRQSIQADVTPRSYAAPPGDRWFGLMVRYVDANNYYYITARNSNTIELKRMLNGAFTTLGSAPLDVALNRNYALRLEAHANQLRMFVEGRLVIKAFDNALAHGRPGITMYRTRADYDNVIVNPDPSIQLKEERFNTPTILMDWDYADYNYQWTKLPTATVFTQPTTGGGAYTFSARANGTDQIIRARMRATQFNGADRWFGLIGRYVDAQNYYYVTLRNSNQISLKKLTNGVVTTLASAATSPVTVNTWYALRLDIVGTRLRVYLNGAMVLETTDNSSPHVAGRAGVGAYKTAAEADDFLVVQP